MARKKPAREMTWCSTCGADAFVKSSLGSTVILDCGHRTSAGPLLAQRDPHSAGPPRLNKRKGGGPTAREVWLQAQAKMGRTGFTQEPTTLSGRFKADPSNVREVERPKSRQEPQDAPARPAMQFDPTAAAKHIGNLLKPRKDKP